MRGGGNAAVRALFLRTRARLEPDARAAPAPLPNATALLLAALAILAPPLSLLALGFLAWLLLGGRRRTAEKYAGLRILR